MAYVRQIVTAVATLGCAAGIGYFMQSSDEAEARYGTPQVADPVSFDAAADGGSEQAADGPVLDVDAMTLTSALDDTPTPPATSQSDVVRAAAPAEIEAPALDERATNPTCDLAMTATPDSDGYVRLNLDAPCRTGERFTLHHSGMMTTQVVTLDGDWDLRLPALTENAVFIAAFPDGEGAVAQAQVPGMDTIERVVLQWRGRSGLELHAREFGAAYGSDGHRYHLRQGEPAAFAAGETGLMMRYGAEDQPDPLLAEVYTFPTGNAQQTGLVDLSVEAEVTVYNCGLEVEAQSLELQGGAIRTQDLTLSVSGCDTIGSFLVLNNLVQDLKIAAK
ncbi:MAG: hypothetical protein AAF218_01745 [Pseudomonadota bacterium]